MHDAPATPPPRSRPPRPTRGLAPWAWAGLAVALTACGPSDHEVGSAVLMATPGIVLATSLVFLLLEWVWYRRGPMQTFRGAGLGVVLFGVVAGLLGVLTFRRGHGDDPGLALLALGLCGATYLTFALVAWRVAFALRPARAFDTAQIPFAGLMVLTAVPAALDTSLAKTCAELLTLAGITGIYAAAPVSVLLVALVVEAVVRQPRQRE